MMGRHTALSLVILGVLLADMAFGASDKLAPYKPFDEPKPKLPQEILTDSRLDKRVKVFVKSKNLQQLFAGLSAKTDVKLLTSQKLWGERAIVYFHDRPLRDVMTEVSNLFGYHWSVKGFPGSYRYELYEDSKYAARRDELDRAKEDPKNELLLDFMKKLADGKLNQDALKQLESSDSYRYQSVTSPRAKENSSLLLQLGEPVLRKVLSGESVSCLFSDLPKQVQTAICDRANTIKRSTWIYSNEHGLELPEPEPLTVEGLATRTIDIGSIHQEYYMPELGLEDQSGKEPSLPGLRAPWLKEGDMRAVTGQSAICLEGDPLPEKPEITIKDLRWIDFWRQALWLGDVLQGIGEQSDLDIIADFHYQRECHRGSVKGIPLDRLVSSLCRSMDYSSRFGDKTIRLRLNKWFVQPLCEEPPASIIEACWKSLEDNGCISLDVQMDIASLPDRQMEWPGFRFIHGADCSYRKDSLQFLKALGPQQLRTIAQSEKGLPASSLLSDQYNQFVQWAATLKADIPPSDLQQSVITMKFEAQIIDEGGDSYKLILNLPDGSSYPARISALQLYGDSIKGYPECHRKDLKADIIEVLD